MTTITAPTNVIVKMEIGQGGRGCWASLGFNDVISIEHDGRRRKYEAIRALSNGNPGSVELLRCGTSVILVYPDGYKVACMIDGKIEGDQEAWDAFEGIYQ